MSDLPLSVVLGIGLAAATGFRVFLPLLIMSGAAYTGHLSLDDSFAWLGTPSALTMLSVAALAEILAYYVPGVDNLLDSLLSLAAPLAALALVILFLWLAIRLLRQLFRVARPSNGQNRR
jgi:Domain of unknown function (DUF4126)